jgi:UDP-glucose-4-epimerase GalE
MNILVTGGAGYIGSHFVKELVAGGHRPVVYDNLSMGHRWAVLTENFHEAELSDKGRLVKVLRDEGIEAVAHFASSIFVGESVEDPMKYYSDYADTLDLLDSIVGCGVKSLVFSSSAAVYGTPVNLPVSEDDPKAPINPYGMSKHFVEETLRAYEDAYGLRYASLRYFNAAGADPGLETGEAHEPETHIIPCVLECALGARDFVEVYGTDYPTRDGTCVRDYVHVSDLSNAHVLALEWLLAGGRSGAFNLGSSRGHSVRDIVRVAGEVTGKDIPVRYAGRRAGDAPVLVADSSLAREALGWRPRHEGLETIIGHAWQWTLKAYEKGYIKKSADGRHGGAGALKGLPGKP